MIRKFLLIVFFLCATSLLHAQDTPPADFTTGTLEFENRNRQYLVYLPENYDENIAAPVVFLLHGAGSTAEDFLMVTGYRRLADKTGTILVIPQGVQNSWGYLDREELHPQDLYTNDWDFLAALIDQTTTEYRIDTERIYLLGYSNGGLLAMRTLCEHGDKLAGVAIIAAGMNSYLAAHCMQVTPTPFLIVRGTSDALFPWSGDVTFKADGRFIVTYSSQQMMSFFHQVLGCSRPEGIENRTAPGSGARVVRDAFIGCRHNSALVLYALFDFPHAYPNQVFAVLNEGKVGTIEDAIWEFFSVYPAPPAEPDAEITPEATAETTEAP